jgi:hypothetical protein
MLVNVRDAAPDRLFQNEDIFRMSIQLRYFISSMKQYGHTASLPLFVSCSLATSATGAFSASRRIVTIWARENRHFLMTHFLQGSHPLKFQLVRKSPGRSILPDDRCDLKPAARIPSSF